MESTSNIALGGFSLHKTTADELAQTLLAQLRQGQQSVLFFANTNFIVQCKDLHERMHAADVMIVNDGVGMDIAALLVQGERFPENLNGTDFIPFLFRQSPRPFRLFLLGGKPDVLQKAADYVTTSLGQELVGSCDGYAGLRDDRQLVDTINQAQADMLLVALGNPIQEKWILDHRAALNARILVGVGALFDFWAGDKPRAPIFVRKIRMEWLYRLSLEPRRLARRYTVDILRFLMYCYRYR